MDLKVIELPEIKVIGINYPDAESQYDLIVYQWIALSAKSHLIKNKVTPNILYGIWHREDKSPSDMPSYLVGFEVDRIDEIPEGMIGFAVPASRYGMMVQKGYLNYGKSYGQLMKWIKESDLEFKKPWTATLEIYDTTKDIGDGYEVQICEPIN
jgi:AraC family transcriptional regulator